MIDLRDQGYYGRFTQDALTSAGLSTTSFTTTSAYFEVNSSLQCNGSLSFVDNIARFTRNITMSSVLETTLASTGAPTPAVSPTPPIVEIFQFVYKSTGLGLTFIWTAITYLYSALRTASFPITAVVSTLYAPLSYILSPFVLSVTIVVNAFVITPYGLLKTALHDVYPIYAFAIVSIIYAGGIGLCARIICRLGMDAMTESADEYTSIEAVGTNPKQRRQTQSGRVVIKDEPS